MMRVGVHIDVLVIDVFSFIAIVGIIDAIIDLYVIVIWVEISMWFLRHLLVLLVHRRRFLFDFLAVLKSLYDDEHIVDADAEK